MPRAGRPAFVLVRPRNPGNIGSAARALSNFGLTDLRVVSAHPPVWEEALRLAADAKSLVKRAKVFPSLPEALADRTRVYGTSSMKGRADCPPVRELPGLRVSGRCAFVFGPENNGLSLDELKHCDAIVRIPTAPSKPAMNLAQAVAVTAYEISARKGGRPAGDGRDLLPFRGVERLVGEMEKALVKIRYRPGMSAAERTDRVRRIVRRRGLSRVEGGMLAEVLRRIEEL